jgi:hypothetical protein
LIPGCFPESPAQKRYENASLHHCPRDDSGRECGWRLTVKRYGECRAGRLPNEQAGASATVNSRLPSAPWLGRWRPAAAGSWRTWPSPPYPNCGLPASGPWGRMRVSRWWAGWPPGRVWFALGAPEFGAVTTRMGFGMPTPVADVLALPIRGRGRRRRLALLTGIAEAAAAVPGDAEPASNGRLIESWCGYQPKYGSRGGHHQQLSCHGRPLPACCRAVTRPESPIGVPTGATARIAAIALAEPEGRKARTGPSLVSNGQLPALRYGPSGPRLRLPAADRRMPTRQPKLAGRCRRPGGSRPGCGLPSTYSNAPRAAAEPNWGLSAATGFAKVVEPCPVPEGGVPCG